MVIEESSKRFSTLIELIKINGTEDQIGSLLEGKSSSDQVLNSSVQGIYSKDFIDWSKYIKLKPVFTSINKILSSNDPDEVLVMKAVSSLITQMFIRLEKNPEFPLRLLDADKLCSIMSQYIKYKAFDINEIKSVLTGILSYINSAERSEDYGNISSQD